MKTRVDTLIKVVELRKEQASRDLQNARNRLDALQKELGDKVKARKDAEGYIDAFGRRGSEPNSLSLHGLWIDSLYRSIKLLSREIEAQEEKIAYCQDALERVYLELKALTQYKQTIQDRHKATIAGLESKELDEIAGRKHNRGAQTI